MALATPQVLQKKKQTINKKLGVKKKLQDIGQIPKKFTKKFISWFLLIELSRFVPAYIWKHSQLLFLSFSPCLE
jgi:hypothetical protein